MIEIDGSCGEGGGQILRTAVSLSAITGEKVLIRNIRSSRPEKGLKPQHLKSIETAALLCNADTEGLYQGSDRICFSPSEIRGVNKNILIGTAGSISLLMQTIMPIAAFSPENTILRIKGGTDVAWSPSVDYVKHVTLKALSCMGYKASVKLEERGYYPLGGGIAEIKIEPAKLKGFDFTHKNERISGISHCSGLEGVARRQACSAMEFFRENDMEPGVDIQTEDYSSTGSGITLWSGMSGSVCIGKKGICAEKTGKRAAQMLYEELKSEASVDTHLADQLIPYMGLAGKGSFTVRELTSHCRTNIFITSRMLDVQFNISKEKELFCVSVE